MTDAPERIWACMGGPMVGLFVSGGNNGGWPEYVRADIVQALTADKRFIIQERDRTFALMLARAKKAEADNARYLAALNQSRLAFAGHASVQSAIDLIDRAALDPNRLRDGVQP